MKRVVVVEGSPRKGHTSVVTDWVVAGLGRSARVERVRVAELNIHGCQECYRCSAVKDGAGCDQQDGMLEVYEKLVDADLVLFASPVFCWGITGQLKITLDRCFALLTGEDLLKGGRWGVILTAGGDHFDGADLVVQMFRRFADFAKVTYAGQFVVADCPDGRKLEHNTAIQQQAREFGRELARSLKDGV